MKRVIVKGETIQEALNKGIKQLKAEQDKVDYTVLEEPKSGFLGFFGKKEAKLEIIKKEDKIKKAKSLLETILKQMELNLIVEVINNKFDENRITFNLTGDNLGIIIGHRGKTLDALQYLLNLAINKGNQEYLRINLDAEGYRERRKNTLQKLALRMAKKAKQKGRKVMLDPMPPHERKIIHTTLQEVERIETYSEGKEPYRKVIIVSK